MENTITSRVMQKIKIDELTINGYMRKYQLSRKRILGQLNLFIPMSNFLNLHSEVLKIRLQAEKEILDYKFYKQ